MELVALDADRTEREIELGAHFFAERGAGWGRQGPGRGDDGIPDSAAELSARPRLSCRAFVLDDGRALFGYERETLLFFRVRAERRRQPASRVRVQASWTAIGASPTPGHAVTSLSLPTHPLVDVAAAAGADALERMRPALARPWKQLERAALDWVVAYADTGEGMGLELTLTVEGAARLEYFPRPILGLDYAQQRLELTEPGARLVVAYQAFTRNGAPPPDLQGVLRVVRGGVESCYEVRAYAPVPLGGR